MEAMFIRLLVALSIVCATVAFTWSRISSGRIVARSSTYQRDLSQVLAGSSSHDGELTQEEMKKIIVQTRKDITLNKLHDIVVQKTEHEL